jgi:hypothetical protein
MSRILTTAAFILAASVAPVATAQTANPPAVFEARDFTDADLKSFAEALVQVSRINDNYLPIYHAAKSPAEQQAVEQKASTEMEQAVQRAGISVDQYHQILGHARSNPEIANRINEHVKEAVTR